MPTGRGHAWVEPELVCEVRYREWTREGHLRHPVFLRLRDDKTPEECVRAERLPADCACACASADAAATENARCHFTQPRQGLLAGRRLHQGRPHRVLPRASRPGSCPTCRDRPLVLTRYPDGIARQVVLPEGRARVRAAMGPHRADVERARASARSTTSSATTSSRCSTWRTSARSRSTSGRAGSRRLERPDWCILDLDPKGAPFAHVVELALRDPRALRGRSSCRLRQDQRLDRPARAGAARRASSPTSSRGPSASCWRDSSNREHPEIATIARKIERARRHASTSTTCRTATARRSPGPSARARCRGRRSRRRSTGTKSGRGCSRETSRSPRYRRGSRLGATIPCERYWRFARTSLPRSCGSPIDSNVEPGASDRRLNHRSPRPARPAPCTRRDASQIQAGGRNPARLE